MKPKLYLVILSFTLLLSSCNEEPAVKVSGDLKTWHKVTLEVPGPFLEEQGDPNPFLQYRLEVTFTNGSDTYHVPGYFAADGKAAETSASSGQLWKVHFSPNQPGTWEYTISFRKGKDIALSTDPDAGAPLPADGITGAFTVLSTDKQGDDFRGKGRLQYSGEHYLFHAGTGDLFLKGGADSPENFLGYRDFDGTWYGGTNKQRTGEDTPNAGLHAYGPHVDDWKEGDPEWQDGKGKGIIGALNYLASKGMNSVYFLTLNILGDGEDVWPYTDRNERYRFDCSKLDQWEIVFAHMEQLGIMMHVVLQETENEQVLDGGYLDVQRKLYLRELVARFAHHNAITWNLGEEHGPVEWMDYAQSVEDTKRMADYLREIDPYDHFIVLHTHPNPENRAAYLPEYLGHASIEGPSIQTGNPRDAHRSTLKWLEASAAAGQPWVVCIDEIGPHWKGALPDADDPLHDTIRKEVLWGNLMAGGGGVEWYFGYRFPHGDLNCEVWRSRDALWEQTRIALDFFREHLPLVDMKSSDALVSGEGYCLARPGEFYAVYYPNGNISPLDLRDATGDFEIRWYDPMAGGPLQRGSVELAGAGGMLDPGLPPALKSSKDWACLVTKKR
ncbi:MAG: DUF5060 domain-containing protein [Bacteroidales bacterium]|nr:DUF5060 domain-containing protein [Bacteroidales bacterium]MDT8431971.1 DUF5060 domain-containing protein [Bacteroidales bacterium]